LYLDKGSMFAVSALPSIISQTLTHTLVPDVQAGSLPIQVGYELIGTDQASAFDVIAPGLFAFASIFLIMTVSGAFTTNREKGLLKRFATTPVSPSEFMMSYVGAYLIFAVLQTILVFAMAFLMGYRPEGGAAGLLFGIILLMVFSVCNVGFGLMTATLAKSPGAATGLAFLFILPQMFLGTFVGTMLSDNVREASQFVPAYYVTNALTSVFSRGASITSQIVLYDTAIVCAMSVSVLAIGIVLFRRYGNR
jgi:ABC-type multidrug transport system permease subunit